MRARRVKALRPSATIIPGIKTPGIDVDLEGCGHTLLIADTPSNRHRFQVGWTVHCPHCKKPPVFLPFRATGTVR
jgi:hypothetical protein